MGSPQMLALKSYNPGGNGVSNTTFNAMGFSAGAPGYGSLAVTQANPQYTKRGHLFVPAQDGANAVVQLSATAFYVQRFWAYGVKGASGSAAPTPNTNTVWIGENDGTNTYFVDSIANDPTNPTLFEPNRGASFNLADFYVLLPTVNDRVLIKYHA